MRSLIEMGTACQVQRPGFETYLIMSELYLMRDRANPNLKRWVRLFVKKVTDTQFMVRLDVAEVSFQFFIDHNDVALPTSCTN
jgi:hypothetical protein